MIEDIQAREKAATPGPWSVSETTDDGFCIPNVAYLMGVMAEENAEFVAHAREDIPYLLAQLEALEEVVQEAGCNLPNPDGSRCGGCGNCRSDRILKGGRLMAKSNEERLRAGECLKSDRCIEPRGHAGPCTGDADGLRAQVARLEADLAAKDAALRDMLTAVEQLGIFPDGVVARNARAALSDTGEGWLPPEAVKRVREALLWCKRNHLGIAKTHAALDALGGK